MFRCLQCFIDNKSVFFVIFKRFSSVFGVRNRMLKKSLRLDVILLVIIILLVILFIPLGCGSHEGPENIVLENFLIYKHGSQIEKYEATYGQVLDIYFNFYNPSNTTDIEQEILLLVDGQAVSDIYYNDRDWTPISGIIQNGKVTIAKNSSMEFMYYLTVTSDMTLGQHEVKIGTVAKHFTVVTVISSAAKLSDLSINPHSLRSGELAFVDFKICNPGEIDQIYTVNLFVDADKVDSKSVPVSEAACVPVRLFASARIPGSHNVLITADGSSSQVAGEFEVIAETGESGSGLTAVPPLTLASATLSESVVSEPYTSADIRPSGGKTPYLYSVTGGGLPAGLRISGFDDYFRIDGTPTTFGEYVFDITVNNSGETTGGVKATFKLAVIPNLRGNWMLTTTVTVAKGVCAGEGGTSTDFITVTQIGRKVTFSGFQSSSASQLTGGILSPKSPSADHPEWVNDTTQWVVIVTGSYWEDGGTTTSTRRLTINTESDMTGKESWTWVGGGGSCPDGEADQTATRVSVP